MAGPGGRVDLAKALQLPHLVRTGQFSLRTRHNPRTPSQRVVKSAPSSCAAEPSSEFQQFLLDHKQLRRNKQEIEERTLLRQHKDVWVGMVRRLESNAAVLGRETEALLANLIQDIRHTDSTKSVVQAMLQQVEQSRAYQENLQVSVGKLHTASRRTAANRGVAGGREEHQRARTKLQSLRTLLVDGLDTLDTECNNIETELAKLRLGEGEEDSNGAEAEAGLTSLTECEAAASPDLLSSDSGFRTDEARSNTEEGGAGELTDTAPELGEEDGEGELMEDSEEEVSFCSGVEAGRLKNYERFDISFSSSGEVITAFPGPASRDSTHTSKVPQSQRWRGS